MLRYDVTYWIGDLRAPEIDSNVTETYLRTLPTSLLAGQTAYFVSCVGLSQLGTLFLD